MHRPRARLYLERLEDRLLPVMPAAFVAVVSPGTMWLIGGYQASPQVQLTWADSSPHPAADETELIRLDNRPQTACGECDRVLLESTFHAQTQPAANELTEPTVRSRMDRFLDSIAEWDGV